MSSPFEDNKRTGGGRKKIGRRTASLSGHGKGRTEDSDGEVFERCRKLEGMGRKHGIKQGKGRHGPSLRVGSAYANYVIIIRPHRSTTYVDAGYCYRPISVVSLSVCPSVCRFVCRSSEPYKNG